MWVHSTGSTSRWVTPRTLLGKSTHAVEVFIGGMVFGFTILLLVSGVAAAADMPSEVHRLLDGKYAGWKPAPVAGQITEWFQEYRFAFDPNRIQADFNEDGRQDWAVYIAHGLHQLASDPPDPFTYLLLYAKGEKDFDFNTLKPFRHAQNSIGLMYFSRTPLRFYWRGGRFRSTLTPSDEE
jgi:hypothetical protein